DSDDRRQAPEDTKGQSKVTLVSSTIELERPKVILTHSARHFVTTVKRVSDPQGVRNEEVVDGWYLAEFESPSANCGPENSGESLWGSSLDSSEQGVRIEHTGPTPKGLPVKL